MMQRKHKYEGTDLTATKKFVQTKVVCSCSSCAHDCSHSNFFYNVITTQTSQLHLFLATSAQFFYRSQISFHR